MDHIKNMLRYGAETESSDKPVLATSQYLNLPLRSQEEAREEAHRANSLFRAICGGKS